MSDAGDDVMVSAPVEEEVTDLNGAVKGVLKRALEVDGVVKGLSSVNCFLSSVFCDLKSHNL